MTVLSPLDLPTTNWAEWLDAHARGELRRAATHVADLERSSPGDAAALKLWNDAAIAHSNATSICSLLSSVHPESAVVELAEEIEIEARAFETDLHLNDVVLAALRSVPTEVLDGAARRVLDDALRTFRRSGVDRAPDVRERIRVLDGELADLNLEFSRNIRDGRTVTRVPVAALDGMPEDFRAEHPAGPDGTVEISTDHPDTLPVLTFCRDADARAAVTRAFLNLGWPVNDSVLARMLDRRHEKATLLGYPSWPDYDSELAMIGSGDAIGAFIDRIAAAAAASGRRDVAILRERAATDGVHRIDQGNWRYYLEAVLRERYGVDATQTRRYFDFARVHDGLLDVTGRLFGLTWTAVPRNRVAPWHPDVTSYDVELDGELLGRIHLDLHPRPGKYNHAAQFEITRGIRGVQLAEGALVCNLPRGLMDHEDVVTLFHEFGHLVHQMLAGRHEWVRFSGVATEWDFVESPSQMLEEWAWDVGVLRRFAVDADGTAIPADLVAAMRRAAEFGKGLQTCTQMYYASVSYRFHLERPADLTARLLALAAEHNPLAVLPDTHFHTGFGHLADYTSGYYTYMWSLVIAKDLFTAFDESDLLSPDVAQRYRDRVLAPGGSRDAATLIEDFLGRPYDERAFIAWLDRT
jgi:thimet oligopeptidase